MVKAVFSRSDVMAINDRVSSKLVSMSDSSSDGPAASGTTTNSRSPASSIAAKVMREIGVSDKKMVEAYSFARAASVKPK
jgi:hypothetical protein